MILFGLYLFMAILLIGGISVDIMRNEFSRLGLQNTVDTAVLAAADLDQTLDPAAVVTDYFNKAGMGSYLDSIDVVENINSRTVTATSSVDVSTLFVNALGINSMPAAASGTAREEISDIEISMVLDVSGSMGSANRLRDLKKAAKNFVNTVLSEERSIAGDGEVSISIVPYSTQVNVGKVIADDMNLSFGHDYSHCVDFESSDFNTTAMPTGNRKQTGHFDPFSRTSPPDTFVCRNEDSFKVQPLTEDKTKLIAQIDALTPNGNTSTDIGIKWGVAMLDPSFRDVTEALIDADEVADTFADRPYDYDRNNSMKVLVVMTDGAQTTQYTLRDQYNQGMSDVWGRQYSDGSWRFSVDHQEYRDKDGDRNWWETWYLPRYDAWSNSRDGGDSSSHRLSYQELWSAASLGYNAYYMWYRQDNSSNLYYDWLRDPYDTVSGSTKDNRMSQLCAKAKSEGILVFSVAFEIDSSDARLMKECASSENHYFDVDGEDIVYAFSAIASTINQLRLVQ
ncbi:pilus assembly protein TadG-related protein [Oceaniglobus trochenteri]|uniref:pilus assembly protein TadG-related protein n=1 Tax=Oceaniglobus trochenteri TaxID=2763260 RepID=UPI001CFFA8A7|nr:pilus assembly protein TadG-related protein [Oceaniglobus trochenteri]